MFNIQINPFLTTDLSGRVEREIAAMHAEQAPRLVTILQQNNNI
jgi:hypothetical protein